MSIITKTYKLYQGDVRGKAYVDDKIVDVIFNTYPEVGKCIEVTGYTRTETYILAGVWGEVELEDIQRHKMVLVLYAGLLDNGWQAFVKHIATHEFRKGMDLLVGDVLDALEYSHHHAGISDWVAVLKTKLIEGGWLTTAFFYMMEACQRILDKGGSIQSIRHEPSFDNLAREFSTINRSMNAGGL